ncbi:CU044_5270 family protein [Spongiactinospora sp. TRM90649]|nr:CU044_5270 family protein [Spongiactinospora sp. TRM90649]MDF5755534.1 CU044_5270 family protein [Spongiactinospora sp. TRM90649]
MDDLQTLATLLAAPEPSSQAAERSLHRLQRRMRRVPRSHRTRWLAVGVGMAAATAIVVSSMSAPTAAPNGPPSASVRFTAGQILLAAAASAERLPEGSGDYWYVGFSLDDGPPGHQTWTARDGRSWVKRRDEPLAELGLPPTPFRLGGLDVSFEQLHELPSEPAALMDWIDDRLKRGEGGNAAGPLNAADRARRVLQGLVSLVTALPATPAVRAASFRALATYPGVEPLGAVDGGQGLLIPSEFETKSSHVRLVVDPETSRVRNTSFFVLPDGGVAFDVSAPVTFEARWTDSLPAGD